MSLSTFDFRLLFSALPKAGNRETKAGKQGRGQGVAEAQAFDQFVLPFSEAEDFYRFSLGIEQPELGHPVARVLLGFYFPIDLGGRFGKNLDDEIGRAGQILLADDVEPR